MMLEYDRYWVCSKCERIFGTHVEVSHELALDESVPLGEFLMRETNHTRERLERAGHGCEGALMHWDPSRPENAERLLRLCARRVAA